MVEQKLSVTQFDYALIEDKDTKGKLINIEGRIKKKRAGMMQSALEIGEELSHAQAVLANHHRGIFKKWVESSFDFSDTTAYNLINVHTRFRESPQIIGRLPDTVLYLLAAPSTPDKAVDDAVNISSKGFRVTVAVAKELIAKHAPKPSTNGKSHGGNGKVQSDPPPTTPTVTTQASSTVAEQIASADKEDDPPEIVELTTQQKCDADNKDIESFCRELTKFFDDRLPDVAWIDSQGRVNSARSSLKACCNTLRQSKSTLCPKCDDGETSKGECTYCKGYGYLPKIMADALGGSK